MQRKVGQAKVLVMHYQSGRSTSSPSLKKMPIPLLAESFWKGLSSIPYGYTIVKAVSWLLVISGLKYFFGGSRNVSERVMHSKVVMVTVSLDQPTRLQSS